MAVQREIATDIVWHIPVNYMTMGVSLYSALYENSALNVIYISTFRIERRAEESSFLKEDTLLLHYKVQQVNAIQRNSGCLL